MTTRIFIFNQTSLNFVLNDIDGNFFGNINGISSYSLKLNFSDTFEKQYNLTSQVSGVPVVLSFFININGEVSKVTGPNQIYLQIGFNDTSTPLLQNTITILPASPTFGINRGSPQSGFTNIVPGTPFIFPALV